MTLLRNDLLIKKARRRTTNQDYGDDYGLEDELFIDALVAAQDELQQFLIDQQCEPFAVFKDIPVVPSQAEYEIPADAYVQNMIYDIYYSRDGTERGFNNEAPLAVSQFRRYDDLGIPWEYYVNNNLFYPWPIPTAGMWRMRYERALDKPDIRRGTITSATVSSGVLTALSVDVLTVNGTPFSETEYISINDSRGNVLARNIQIIGYNETTGAFTFPGAGVALESGETVPVGAYVCKGARATTHMKLQPFCEAYFVKYLQEETLISQSSTDSSDTNPQLLRMLEKIAEAYNQTPGNKIRIPEMRGDY